jgi:hypothetical protein
VQEVSSNADFRTSMARLALRLLRSMSLRKRMADRAKAALALVGPVLLDAFREDPDLYAALAQASRT